MASTPADPNKREDVELLKLVGAVLESTRKGTKGRKIPSILHRLRRARDAVSKRARKHPLVSISVLVALITTAYLLGVSTTSYAQKEAAEGAAGVQSGSLNPMLSSTGTGAPLNENRGTGRVVDPRLGQRNVAKDLITRVVEGDYERRSDVATGRFLQDFENQWLLLVDVHRSQMQPARRGTNWVQLRAPYRISDTRENHRTHLTTLRTWKVATEALIRLVKQDDWKLEYIRVY